ncbi:MAG: hypothetical protein IPO31_10455 [Candidatus Obscuribacter sp.]|nr:hypothetical protein [Candidatus Obscuribacter sp.]
MGLSNSCARAADRVAATDRGFVEDEDEVEEEDDEEDDDDDDDCDNAFDGVTPA